MLLGESLLSAEGDAFLSLTILWGRQANTGGQHRVFSMGKPKTKLKSPKETWQLMKVHISSLLCHFSMCAFSMKAKQQTPE